MKTATRIRLVLIFGAIAVLELLCRTKVIAPITMVPPSVMLIGVFELLASGRVLPDLLRTLASVATVICISVIGGILIGVLLFRAARLRQIVDPLLTTWYAIPAFIFYPILVAIFGLSTLPIILIAVKFAIVTMIVNTLNGLDRVPQVMRKVARVHRLGRFDTFRLVVLRNMAPSLMGGFKLTTAYSFIGVIASEFLLSTAGLGFSIARAYESFETRRMYSLMLLIVGIAILLNAGLFIWERRMLARRFNR